MRIVLDTNILVRANPLASPSGLARELLLRIVSSDEHTLLLSSAILIEVTRVLTYPHVRQRWSLTEREILEYVSALEMVSICIEIPALSPSVVLDDPDDDPILQTAIVGRADVLCTRDAAFSHRVVREVSSEYGFRILSDVELINELRGSP